MSPEEFRKAGHELIDWIADYRLAIATGPVRARVGPGDVKASFSENPPERKGAFSELLTAMDENILPGVTQVQHPMHFGWFPSNAALASVLGDIASSGMGTLGISWESCPALTEVESVTCDWMRQLVGLSGQWEGTIHDTASTAALVAMLLAREKATDFAEMRGGLQSCNHALTVYTTAEAHSSIQKAALLAGFGRDNIRLVEMDPVSRSMDADALDQQIEQDLAHGMVPAIIVASVGSTGVTAIDPVAPMASVARDRGVWLHVDAAMAGSAMLLPECRHLWLGVEEADSVSWNPHKWMGTLLDCSLFYVRDVEHLVRVMSTNPSYLRSSVDGEVVQYRDWGIPLGRRFRALKLWFHLHLDGTDAIRERLRRDLEHAREFASKVEQADHWRVVSPVNLQTVCIRHEPPDIDQKGLDQHTLNWVQTLNQSGKAFLTPAKLDDKWMVRVSIGVESTERE
ncbi:MAG: pyridoxal-dependent decarboxylase, partial [Pseudomonadota bacterium]